MQMKMFNSKTVATWNHLLKQSFNILDRLKIQTIFKVIYGEINNYYKLRGASIKGWEKKKQKRMKSSEKSEIGMWLWQINLDKLDVDVTKKGDYNVFTSVEGDVSGGLIGQIDFKVQGVFLGILEFENIFFG